MSGEDISGAVTARVDHGPEVLQQNLDRIHFLRRLIGVVGISNTCTVVYNRLRYHDAHKAISVRYATLREPLAITTEWADLHTVLEVAIDEVYALAPELGKNVEGAIVDIGANIGATSAYFASHYPNSKVLAIEPHARNYELLRTNTAAYDNAILPIHAGFAAEPGRVGLAADLYALRQNYASALFSPIPANEPSSNESAPAITPSDILEQLEGQRVGLLKIDIEGAERDIFKSSTVDPLLRQTDLMLIETHDRYMPGSSQAVQTAAGRSGLQLWSQAEDSHTTIYSRQAA